MEVLMGDFSVELDELTIAMLKLVVPSSRSRLVDAWRRTVRMKMGSKQNLIEFSFLKYKGEYYNHVTPLK